MINVSNGTDTHVIPFQAGTVKSMFLDPANGELYIADPSKIFVLTIGN